MSNEPNLADVRRCVLTALAYAKAARVEIRYDGYGDQGNIASIDAVAHRGRRIDLSDFPAPHGVSDPYQKRLCLHGAVEQLAWRLLDQHHGGFENNEGGFGTITIDVVAGTIRINHSDCIVETVETETEA